jgi:hypothetical protein
MALHGFDEGALFWMFLLLVERACFLAFAVAFRLSPAGGRLYKGDGLLQARQIIA